MFNYNAKQKKEMLAVFNKNLISHKQKCLECRDINSIYDAGRHGGLTGFYLKMKIIKKIQLILK